jgi:hypothetical protein
MFLLVEIPRSIPTFESIPTFGTNPNPNPNPNPRIFFFCPDPKSHEEKKKKLKKKTGAFLFPKGGFHAIFDHMGQNENLKFSSFWGSKTIFKKPFRGIFLTFFFKSGFRPRWPGNH